MLDTVLGISRLTRLAAVVIVDLLQNILLVETLLQLAHCF